VPTAVLGGFVFLGFLLFWMNFKHPYAKYAKELYITVPIVPAVSGIVVDVPVEANQEVEEGAVLFQIDPKPYQLEVDRIEAKLVDARQAVKETGSTLERATAAVEKAVADRDRSEKAFERAAEAGAEVLPQDEIDNKRQLYLANEAVLEAEVIFDAVPGHIFEGTMVKLLPVIPEAELQPGGTLVSGDILKHHDRMMALIELEEDLNQLGLPIGIQGRAAVYADQDALHSSPVRRILLRMMGWLNYLYPIKK
jgi:multidrug resistance efflux pump